MGDHLLVAQRQRDRVGGVQGDVLDREPDINGCDDVSIHSVYGGGNAASTPATDVKINGAYEIEYVFGGGNGAGTGNPGANVGYHAYDSTFAGADSASIAARRERYAYGSGKAKTEVYGGRIHKVFGGSNTLGNVREATVAMLDEVSDCKLTLDGIYGGGKSAYMEGNAEIELLRPAARTATPHIRQTYCRYLGGVCCWLR